jgi:hypothetical protein
VTVVESDRRFEFRWPWLPGEAWETTVSVRLEPAGYGTLLTLTDGPFDLRVPGVLDAYAEALEGWGRGARLAARRRRLLVGRAHAVVLIGVSAPVSAYESEVAARADRASWIVATPTWSFNSSYSYTTSIHGQGPRMKRNPCQRPPSFDPINGKDARGSSDPRTRALVDAGRLSLTIRWSRSATAGSERTTVATGSKVLETYDATSLHGTATLEGTLICAGDGVEERGHGLGIGHGLVERGREQ